MRQLDAAKIEYTPMEYVPDENDLSGVHIAEQIGLPEEQVFKTLVAIGDKTGGVVFVIPCRMELDLKKCAAASGNKRVELVHVKDLLGMTGYIRGGCSPVGMKKKFPTFFDETAELFDEIAVSAGVRGAQIIAEPMALCGYVEAKLLDLTVRKEY